MPSTRIRHRVSRLALALSLAIPLAGAAQAQQTEPAGDDPSIDKQKRASALDSITVVGSQINNARIAAALPTTVIAREDIEASGAQNGDELFRRLAQNGDVAFNPTVLSFSSNAARGDVGSINLRNLGAGNTLLLINGRRTVLHPTTNTSANSYTYNSNAIPVGGLSRVEILRDGAAAIYGSDAVAGVVNTVLESNLDGGTASISHGWAPGTHLSDSQLDLAFGKDAKDGRGNVSFYLSLAHREPQYSDDQPYTRSSDKRPLFTGTALEGALSLDQRGTQTPWGTFQVVGANGPIYRNGAAITDALGYFHIQPSTFAGSLVNLGNGISIDDGNPAHSGVDRELRTDTSAFRTTITPKVDRFNGFLNFHRELSDSVELFGEAGLYYAKAENLTPPAGSSTISLTTVPASNYWNPFGALYLPDGSLNPNRLPGLDNVPEEGVDVHLSGISYLAADLGSSYVEITNRQSRALLGLRGEAAGFQWETALLYSEAKSRDHNLTLIPSLWQDSLALSTPEAYNPFNGGTVDDPDYLDATASSQAALGSIRDWITRQNRTTLALWDAKANRADLFDLPAGAVGIAAGVEFRRETYEDNRDARIDGTLTYTNAVTGVTYGSDAYGTSPSPDVDGSRNVSSAFVELQVPLVSEAQGVPLVKFLDLQLAGRYEHYSDVGSAAKPKLALAWGVSDGLTLRGSFSQGFSAPHLELVNAPSNQRATFSTDWTLCEADVRSGRINGYSDCSRSVSVVYQNIGNKDLEPEESETTSYGFVWQPTFLPAGFGRLSFSADWWTADLEGVIGTLGVGNHLIYDLLLRQRGSSNPDLVRLEARPDQVAEFEGTGLEAAGDVLLLSNKWINQQPISARGLDLGLTWNSAQTAIGSFRAAFNAAKLSRYYAHPTEIAAELLAAQAAGELDPAITISGGADRVRQGALPHWRISGSLGWQRNGLSLNAYANYTGSVISGAWPDGTAYVVDSTTITNLSAGYRFREGWLADTRVELGVNNVFDKDPPLTASGSYLAALYQPYSRYLYLKLSRSF